MLQLFSQLDIVGSMSRARFNELVGARELVNGVVTNRGEKPEPRFVGSILRDPHQALAYQLRQDGQGISAGSAWTAVHPFHCRCGETTREDATRSKNKLLTWREQVVAPGDGRLERLMAGRQIALNGPQKRSACLQPLQNGRWSKDRRLSRGQLDREWQAIQANTDLGDGRQDLVAELEGCPPRPSSLAEQHDRRDLADKFHVVELVQIGHRQRLDEIHAFGSK